MQLTNGVIPMISRVVLLHSGRSPTAFFTVDTIQGNHHLAAGLSSIPDRVCSRREGAIAWPHRAQAAGTACTMAMSKVTPSCRHTVSRDHCGLANFQPKEQRPGRH